MSDVDKTPAETPESLRRSRPDWETMDTRHSGNGVVFDEASAVRLSSKPPELKPLPTNPTPLDVAVRYGTFASFILIQWPLLVRTLQSLDERVARLESAGRRQWFWPLLAGLAIAAAVAGWAPRILAWM